jgi:hypothetical protein
MLWAEHDALLAVPAQARTRGPANGATHEPGTVEPTGDRLGELVRSIGRRTEEAGRAAALRRPTHIVAMIGVPPVDLDARRAWRDAAAAIESYEARWAQSVAGDEPSHAPAQIADRRAVETLVARLATPPDDRPAAPTEPIDLGGGEAVSVGPPDW